MSLKKEKETGQGRVEDNKGTTTVTQDDHIEVVFEGIINSVALKEQKRFKTGQFSVIEFLISGPANRDDEPTEIQSELRSPNGSTTPVACFSKDSNTSACRFYFQHRGRNEILFYRDQTLENQVDVDVSKSDLPGKLRHSALDPLFFEFSNGDPFMFIELNPTLDFDSEEIEQQWQSAIERILSENFTQLSIPLFVPDGPNPLELLWDASAERPNKRRWDQFETIFFPLFEQFPALQIQIILFPANEHSDYSGVTSYLHDRRPEYEDIIDYTVRRWGSIPNLSFSALDLIGENTSQLNLQAIEYAGLKLEQEVRSRLLWPTLVTNHQFQSIHRSVPTNPVERKTVYSRIVSSEDPRGLIATIQDEGKVAHPFVVELQTGAEDDPEGSGIPRARQLMKALLAKTHPSLNGVSIGTNERDAVKRYANLYERLSTPLTNSSFCHRRIDQATGISDCLETENAVLVLLNNETRVELNDSAINSIDANFGIELSGESLWANIALDKELVFERGAQNAIRLPTKGNWLGVLPKPDVGLEDVIRNPFPQSTTSQGGVPKELPENFFTVAQAGDFRVEIASLFSSWVIITTDSIEGAQKYVYFLNGENVQTAYNSRKAIGLYSAENAPIPGAFAAFPHELPGDTEFSFYVQAMTEDDQVIATSDTITFKTMPRFDENISYMQGIKYYPDEEKLSLGIDYSSEGINGSRFKQSQIFVDGQTLGSSAILYNREKQISGIERGKTYTIGFETELQNGEILPRVEFTFQAP